MPKVVIDPEKLKYRIRETYERVQMKAGHPTEFTKMLALVREKCGSSVQRLQRVMNARKHNAIIATGAELEAFAQVIGVSQSDLLNV